jgi:hypothetical protein
MVRAYNQLVKEYQALLTENESLTSVECAAKLVWDVLGGRIEATASGVALEPLTSNAGELARHIQSSPQPRDAFDIEGWERLVSAQPAKSREHRRLRPLVLDAAVALTIVPVVAPHGSISGSQYSLLIDSCLLLAHHAYFGLLPRLNTPTCQPERAFLLSAFHQFADSLNRAADRFALLALYFDAVGEPQKAIESQRAALVATPADAHDFMTMLQNSWSSLVARGMLGDALDLLLETYPRVSRRDLDEVGELIRQTFKYSITAANGHARRGKAVKQRKAR